MPKVFIEAEKVAVHVFIIKLFAWGSYYALYTV